MPRARVCREKYGRWEACGYFPRASAAARKTLPPTQPPTRHAPGVAGRSSRAASLPAADSLRALPLPCATQIGCHAGLSCRCSGPPSRRLHCPPRRARPASLGSGHYLAQPDRPGRDTPHALQRGGDVGGALHVAAHHGGASPPRRQEPGEILGRRRRQPRLVHLPPQATRVGQANRRGRREGGRESAHADLGEGLTPAL